MLQRALAKGTGRWFAGIAGCASALLLAGPAGAGSCEQLSPSSANVSGYGTDYLPRIDFSPGAGEQCGYPLPPELPGALALPLYGYNLQGEITGARLRLESTAQITHFAPSVGVVIVHAEGPAVMGSHWCLDLELSGQLCGPALFGDLELLIPAGATGAYADLAGYGGVGAPLVIHAIKGALPAISPRHGARVGAPDPYHCQLPLCQEPNAPARDFLPLQSGGFVMELGWTAGGGDFTMIRYRADGIPPTSVFDGELLTLMPTSPGQSYAVIHENPEASQYWYTAFAVTLAGSQVSLGGQLECDSFTTARVDPSIPVTSATWGAVKNSYR